MRKQFISESLSSLICAMADPELVTSDIVRMMNEYVPAVAEEIELTSIEYRVFVPSSFMGLQPALDERGLVFDSSGGKTFTYHEHFDTKNRGFFELNATSEYDDEEQRAAFKALANLLFAMCGKINSVTDLRSLAVTDHLTGAMNMNGFRRAVAGVIQSGCMGEYFSAFINIKNFKYINQKVGMQNGDMILRELVLRFHKTVGKDNFIARLGGDNFIILAKNESFDALDMMLRGFIVPIRDSEGKAEIKVYFRTGIFYCSEDTKLDDIMNCSGCAYATARGGKKRDFVVFEPAMMEAELRTKRVLVTFPEALKNKEFKVFYQPKVSSHDNKMVGAEALTRWMHDGKMVPPMDFITVLERFGNISQLDLYVVETVASDIRNWLDRGLQPVRVSVNISRRDLSVPALAQKINDIVDRYRIPHDLIEIELTETYTTDEFSRMLMLINDLRSFGFKISIDDFGSGYSTLTLLKSIHADIIKLDRAFIKDMTESSREDKIILRNVVHMVNELKIEVIAEGIETAEQVSFLDNIGCGIIQGYYYDKPLPHDEFEERLSDTMWYVKKAGEIVV